MKKSKILLSIALVIMLASTYCFATIEPRVENVENTIQNNISLISEQEGNTIASTTQGNEIIVNEDQEPQSDETVSEANNSTTQQEDNFVENDLYLTGDKIDISQTVDGNAFVMGKEVTISGQIAGNLFVMADKLTIDEGYVISSIFACAKEITIKGAAYDLYAVCNNFNLEGEGFIYRDLRLIATDANIKSIVRRNAYISAEKINFSENTDTVIFGNLKYSSKSELDIPNGAVGGEVVYDKPMDTGNNITNIILSYVISLLSSLLFTLVITLILLWLTPKFVEKIGNMKLAKDFSALGIGIISPIVLVLICLLLSSILIGTNIMLCSIFAYIIIALIAFSITSIFFSKLLAKYFKIEGNKKFVLLTLLSNGIIWGICQIPIIGGFLSLLVVAFGIGTTFINIVCKESKKEEKVEKAEE